MKKISPHLTIYKFPITAISSITNRVTGLGLTGLYLGYGLSRFTNADNTIQNTFNQLGDNTKRCLFFPPVFSATYHTFGGIRHIILDKYPTYLNNHAMKKSSLLLFVGSAIISGISTELLKNSL